MYEFLNEINQRPEPFGEYTARELWTDPHTSQKMLAYHLDENVDAASRNHNFLDRSAAWIVSRFGLSPGTKVADFGCGPGLYAQRLARGGLSVTGIDFSENSLKYAREAARVEGLDIEYVQADYLEFETDQRFDLIMMIMCDYCALSPHQREALARKFRSLLASDGMILFDVYQGKMFDSREEAVTYAPNLLDGFWSPREYHGFLSTFKYEDEQLLLDKYTIVEPDRVVRIYNWLQCFSLESITSECARHGLRVVESWGDVAGAPYDPEATELAVVAKVERQP